MTSQELPEWKKSAFGGNKASYGKKTKLSIVEQRQSLPIYRLKKELVQVRRENSLYFFTRPDRCFKNVISSFAEEVCYSMSFKNMLT